MSDSAIKGARSLVALAAVVAMFMGFSVASASAAEITLSNSTVETSVFPEPVEITVTGTGFGAYSAANVRVGVCQTPPIQFVPPCGAFAGNVTINGSGELDATIELESATIKNDHFGVTPLQPEFFTCGTSNCEVLVTNHVGGGKQEVLDSAGLHFD